MGMLAFLSVLSPEVVRLLLVRLVGWFVPRVIIHAALPVSSRTQWLASERAIQQSLAQRIAVAYVSFRIYFFSSFPLGGK